MTNGRFWRIIGGSVERHASSFTALDPSGQKVGQRIPLGTRMAPAHEARTVRSAGPTSRRRTAISRHPLHRSRNVAARRSGGPPDRLRTGVPVQTGHVGLSSSASGGRSVTAAVAGSVNAADPSAAVSCVSVSSAPGATDLVGNRSSVLVIAARSFQVVRTEPSVMRGRPLQNPSTTGTGDGQLWEPVSPNIGGLEMVILVPFDIAAVDTADRNDLWAGNAAGRCHPCSGSTRRQRNQKPVAKTRSDCVTLQRRAVTRWCSKSFLSIPLLANRLQHSVSWWTR